MHDFIVRSTMSGLGRLPLMLWCCMIALMHLHMKSAGEVIDGMCPASPWQWDTYEFHVGDMLGPEITMKRKELIESYAFYLDANQMTKGGHNGQDTIHRRKYYELPPLKKPPNACSVRLLVVEGPNQKEEYKNKSNIFLMEDFHYKEYSACNVALTAQNLTWKQSCWPVRNQTREGDMRGKISGRDIGHYGFDSTNWTAVLGFECCFDLFPAGSMVYNKVVLDRMIELRKRFQLTKSAKGCIGVKDTETNIDCDCVMCRNQDNQRIVAGTMSPVAAPKKGQAVVPKVPTTDATDNLPMVVGLAFAGAFVLVLAVALVILSTRKTQKSEVMIKAPPIPELDPGSGVNTNCAASLVSC